PDGNIYQVLHDFAAGNDGAYPVGPLLQGSGGVLYGTTANGGAFVLGTVFRLNSDGSGFAVLKSFSGPDGSEPEASLAWGMDGAIYGTTRYGGANGRGTVFKLNPNGLDFAVLHSF